MNAGASLSTVDSIRKTLNDDISSTEWVECCLARIKRYNPAINAVVTTNEEGALAAARRADAMRGNARLPPLHGIPITVKDAFETAGVGWQSAMLEPAFRSYPESMESGTDVR